MQLCDDKELDECINKGREIEDKLKKIIEKSRRQKLALKKEFKKKVKEDEEMLAVKRKYYDSRKALYDERSEHIKSIPHFWKTAFLGFKNLRKHLSDGDEKIIEFLESVVVDDGHNQKSITFFFKKNQYFENLFLKKIYSHTHKGIVNESGTKILWKKGTGTTIGSETEDPALMDIGNRHISFQFVQKYCYAKYADIHPLYMSSEYSFFTRFFDPQDKDLPKKPRDEDVNVRLLLHRQVLEAIEEHLWPSALVHFRMGSKKMP
ncbi:hypothetical protein C5167_007948 [Papaver somniferum]|uniref:Uncharacterized protein n=1 Tax=Papaver somniferum TaxID=3469 RepID=A0A4Y7JX10_PAPSO|nr:hypothetical protein C5167_007948 [Papaver somniferum]